MCSQDDAPDTKKHFTRTPLQDKSLPGESRSSFHPQSYNPFFFPPAETPDGLISCHLNFQRCFCSGGTPHYLQTRTSCKKQYLYLKKQILTFSLLDLEEGELRVQQAGAQWGSGVNS